MSRNCERILDLDFINLETIVDIQKDIDSSDMISLMFLLYEDPKTALKKLLVYQQLASDIGDGNADLLHEWAAQANSRRTWRWELLEALVTCQLYTVVKKLGFPKQTVIKIFQKDNYVSPMRKIFYRVCENMDTTSYGCLKQNVNSDFGHILDSNICEIVFLKLMCLEVFTSVPNPDEFQFTDNIKRLLKIISNIPTCKTLVCELESICAKTNDTTKTQTSYLAAPTTSKVLLNQVYQNMYVEDLTDEYQELNELSLENLDLEDLKTDDSNEDIDGLCYIINQEKFLPVNPNPRSQITLKDRPESAADKSMLTKTMTDHRIKVLANDNLSRKQMLDSIKSVVKNHFKKQHHKVFFLCILSHGDKDHVYSANYERVNILQIEDLLDSDDAISLRTIPKVLIIQACQTDDIELIADSSKHYIDKSHMITFCSTAPGFEAYRIRGKSSIFINHLCSVIDRFSATEHLVDLFTKVNKEVEDYCSKNRINQRPIILRNTLNTSIRLRKRIIP